MSKIAIITGASRGLGKSMALNLADKGRDIILTYRSQQEPAQAVVREIEQKGRKAVALRLDVQRADSFDDFAARVRQALSETFQRERLRYPHQQCRHRVIRQLYGNP